MIGNLLAQLTDLIVTHRSWAGLLFGLLAFGESLAVVGTIIPATPILFLVGTLLGSGKVDAVPVVGCAIVGAIVGYWTSWRVGRAIGPSVYHAKILRGQRRGIARARLFFRKWGGPSLIVGRFVLGPVQSMLPLVAGVAAMESHCFNWWNLLSSVIWVFVVLAPGFFTARGVTLFGIGAAQQSILIGGLLIASLVLIVLALGGTFLQVARHRNRR